jgi:hypothetical protein
VGHDVVQLASDADPLFADLLAGELGLGGALPLRLLGQSGLIAPPGRDTVADEPGRGQRQQAVAYASAPPRAAALTPAAVIDTRLGSREAAQYEADPSTMPNGNVTMPLAMISAFATVATASTVNGQRRSSATGLQATPTRRSCGTC